MPAPRHIRMVWSGVFGSVAVPVEEWSFSLSAIPGTADPDNTSGPTIAAALSDKFVELQQGIGTNAHRLKCRLSVVGADGREERQSGGQYKHWDGEGTSLSGTGTPRGPLQMALAVSLRSTMPGPTGRGRFYLPSPDTGILGTDGRMQTPTRDSHLTRANAFITGVNTVLGAAGLGLVCIASGGSASQGIQPGLRPVTGVGVGRVVDTQRRRRGDLLEETAWL